MFSWGMPRLTWYDPDTNPSQFLAALWRVRHLCTRAEAILPHTRVRGSVFLVEAIKSAIDDYAEREMGNREYFWDRPRRGGQFAEDA
jgi:hypothetical protein